MPPRSVKMNRFIFGFQRRVWWPKWTPASSNSFMETTGIASPFLGFGWDRLRRRLGGTGTKAGHRPRRSSAGSRVGKRSHPSGYGSPAEAVEVGGELGRKRRIHLDGLTGERVREGKPGRVQELAAKAGLGDAVDRI